MALWRLRSVEREQVGVRTTYFAPKESIERKWFVVDADGVPLGRLASQVACILKGKHKTIYAPHVDVGDHVIVVNADRVVLTGKKPEKKMYYRHSFYPGGLKVTSAKKMMQERPERVIELAVKGMLPKNRLGREMIRKLKVYRGPTHPHQAQKPERIELGGGKRFG